ncbi:hypothetical protein D3C80_1988080 [compost metagenome]
MAKISRQVDYHHMVVLFTQANGQFQAVVRRAIVNQDDFVTVTYQSPRCLGNTLVKFINVTGRLVQGCNDRQLHGRTYLM